VLAYLGKSTIVQIPTNTMKSEGCDMKKLTRLIAILFSLLIVSLPICFAAELNLTYDPNGNLVSGDGFFREYNSLNQLMKIRNGSTNVSTVLEEYTYDPVEERVAIKKNYVGGALKDTTYYFDKEYVRVVNSTGTFDYEYVYLDGQLVAQVNPDGSKYFISGDIKGSNTVVTNATGAVIENTTYGPYGDLQTGGAKSKYGYEGKERDSMLGDMDFNARRAGIAGTPPFQQPDVIISNVYDPQSLNRYSFERNNPQKNTDPTGHIIPLIVAAIIIWGATLSLAPVIYQTIHGTSNTKQNFYGASEAALDILTTVADIPYGIVSTAINTYQFVKDPKSYMEGKTGYTAAGTMEKIWDNLWNKKKDKCKDDCAYTAEIYTIPNSNAQSEINLANRYVTAITEPKSGSNQVHLTAQGGSITNNVWNYDRIGGVPWVNERTPSGTNVVGGWHKK
jgi:RHS repeat-associated protein